MSGVDVWGDRNFFYEVLELTVMLHKKADWLVDCKKYRHASIEQYWKPGEILQEIRRKKQNAIHEKPFFN